MPAHLQMVVILKTIKVYNRLLDYSVRLKKKIFKIATSSEAMLDPSFGSSGCAVISVNL